MRRLLAIVWTCCALALSGAAIAAPAHGPDKPEPGSEEAIARFTTDPRFLNPWVAYVPFSSTVPSPTRHLGHVAGAPGELSGTDQIYGYLRRLAEASPRVRVDVIGRTEEGRDIVLAAIADEAGLRDLERLKAATAALADPRRTSPAEAERIAATARPIYYFNAGLHSIETGSPEMVMELAYRLAVSEQPMIRGIRENVIVLINPVSEPDGRDKMVDWFYRYLKGKTDYDRLPPVSPPYWGRYVFHDNNRDTHQRALESTRAVHRMFHDYHPTVVHDLHESIPLLHTWNGTGPYNTQLDPILTSEWLEMSFHEVTTLTALGMPGVWTWGFGEAWGQHYLDSVASNHNSIGRGYETFGNHTAETVERVLRSDEERYAGRPVTTREWYRPWPPDRKLTWSLRDNTNYMQTGCLAILDWAARNGRRMLMNFYRKGYNSWRKGVDGAPYAYIIPEDQGDRLRVAGLVNLLMDHRIEVARARGGIDLNEGEFPRGSFVVRLDQPYRNYAVDLLEPQEFPRDAPQEPYDDVSWALSVHHGVEAVRIDDERIGRVRLSPLREPVTPVGRVSGKGPVFLLRDTGQEALLTARHRLAAFEVEIAKAEFEAGGVDYPAGSWILPEQDGLLPALQQVASELALDFESVAELPRAARDASPVPRLALWHTWADTQAIGWVRYVLDRERIPYTWIRDEDVRAGRLRDRFDIVLHGHVDLDLQEQILGIDPAWGPMPYTRTETYESHGVPDASEDITGGIGWTGMASLQRFLDDGGMLVTLGNGSALALEGGLARNVRLSDAEVSTPGAEITATFLRPEHPIEFGYGESISVFRGDLPVYKLRPADQNRAVMQWGTRPPAEERDEPSDARGGGGDEMIVSGGGKGLDGLEGRPAILEIPAGDRGHGRIVAFNFNPIHRDLNRSDHRLLWNVLLNWRSILPVTNPAAGRP